MIPLPSLPLDGPDPQHPGKGAPLPLGELPLPSKPFFPPVSRKPLPGIGRPVETPQASVGTSPGPPDFTDADLAEALRPFLSAATTVTSPPTADDERLETLLRATFRRALSEHSSGPFQDPGLLHRSIWRLQALIASRSYDEVLQEKLRRFHVDEVYLLDRSKLSLVSFASADPVRHSQPRRVEGFARRLAHGLKDESGALHLTFLLRDGRRCFIREGRFTYLAAVTRGEPDEFAKADLDHALKRVERRFRLPFERGEPLLLEIQPFLEDCLLIHSPASPVAA